MPALEKSVSAKKFYTAVEDEAIVSMVKEKRTVKEIAQEVGHSMASIQYRINRVLTVQNLDEIKYRG